MKKRVTIVLLVLAVAFSPSTAISPAGSGRNAMLAHELGVVSRTSSMPWFEVSPASTVVDPNLGGAEYNISVDVRNLDASLHAVGFKFDLVFNSTFTRALRVEEGDFVRRFATNGQRTLFTSFLHENASHAWVSVGEILLSNMSGFWDNFPEGNGTIAYISFTMLDQDFTRSCFSDFVLSSAAIFDENETEIPIGAPENGSLEILPATAGTWIDLYGGAVNGGWDPLTGAPYLQFPAPYGGQGLQAPMDMVEPQSWVYLNANVIYNYWPVQHKNVAFEIQEPDGTVYNKLSTFTDSNGVASVGFRMPWPCVDPESLFGVWHITATVQLADVVINDTMNYHYDYLVHVWKVTTDKFQYNLGECVQITYESGSYTQQTYSAFFVVSIVDYLGVTVGIATVKTTFGGTVHCLYENSTAQVPVCAPKWAYAGIATIHVKTFDQNPAEGGVAITPEYVGPTIAIRPY